MAMEIQRARQLSLILLNGKVIKNIINSCLVLNEHATSVSSILHQNHCRDEKVFYQDRFYFKW